MAHYRLGAALAALAVAISCPAFAQIPPNETDLKAAFCLGVLNAYTPADSAKATTPEIARLEAETETKVLAARQRVQAYLMPRLQFIDQTSIFYAMAEGRRADEQAAAQFSKCQWDPASISALSNRNAKTLAEAMNKCMGAINDRIKSCYDPSFLPF